MLAEDYLRESKDRQERRLRAKESIKAKQQARKERVKELNEQVPEAQTMRRVVQEHARYLLRISQHNLNMPPPPSDKERKLAIERISTTNVFDQMNATTDTSSDNHTQALDSLVQTHVQELGLTRFTFDWLGVWKNPFNQLMKMVFFHTLDITLGMGEYSNWLWSSEHCSHAIVSAFLETYFCHLQSQYRLMDKGGKDAIEERNKKKRLRKKRERLAQRRKSWCEESGYPELAAQFNQIAVCSDTEELVENSVTVYQKLKLDWRSESANKLMEYIDHQILMAGRIGKRKRQPKYDERRAAVNLEMDPLVPEKLSFQFYDAVWLAGLQPFPKEKLKIKQIRVIDDMGEPLQPSRQPAPPEPVHRQ